jgi:hypothetical protein
LQQIIQQPSSEAGNSGVPASASGEQGDSSLAIGGDDEHGRVVAKQSFRDAYMEQVTQDFSVDLEKLRQVRFQIASL